MDETYLEQMRLREQDCNLRILVYKRNIKALEDDIGVSKSLIDMEKKHLERETDNRDKGIAEKDEYIKREGLA